MRVLKVPLLLGGIAVAITAGATLPMEGDAADYPELTERFGYRLMHVSRAGPDTTRVRLTHADHRTLSEEQQSARALKVAELMRVARPELSEKVLIVDLAWTWRSDLLSRRTYVRQVVMQER